MFCCQKQDVETDAALKMKLDPAGSQLKARKMCHFIGGNSHMNLPKHKHEDLLVLLLWPRPYFAQEQDKTAKIALELCKINP